MKNKKISLKIKFSILLNFKWLKIEIQRMKTKNNTSLSVKKQIGKVLTYFHDKSDKNISYNFVKIKLYIQVKYAIYFFKHMMISKITLVNPTKIKRKGFKLALDSAAGQ